MSGMEKRISEAAEEYFRALERDAYRPEGCNGDDIAKHLIQALGLTEERRMNGMSSGGQTTNTRTGVTTAHMDYRYDHRFVTAWSPDE